MRLRDIQEILAENSQFLVAQPISIQNDNGNRRIDNTNAISKAVREIEKTGILKTDIKILKQTESVFLSHTNSVVVPAKEGIKFSDQIGDFKNKVVTIQKAISELLPEQSENSLSLKLPDITDLKELSDVSQKLDKIFDQLLVNSFVEGKANVQNFDTGSEWIEIVFNSNKPLMIVVSVVYAAILLKREKIKNEEMIEIVRNRKITNDTFEKLSKELLSSFEDLKNEQAKRISEIAECPKDEKEYERRVKVSIDRATDLIDRGLKFFPASKAPTEVKSLLPDFTKKRLDDMLPEGKMLNRKKDES